MFSIVNNYSIDYIYGTKHDKISNLEYSQNIMSIKFVFQLYVTSNRAYEVLGKGSKILIFNCLTQFTHQTLIIMQIMDCVKMSAQYFTAAIQMVQIGPCVILAGVAITFWVQRTRVLAKATIADLDRTL